MMLFMDTGIRRCDRFNRGGDAAPTTGLVESSCIGLKDPLGAVFQDQAGEFAGDVGTGVEADSVCLEVRFVGYGVAMDDDLFVWLCIRDEVFSDPQLVFG